MSRGTWSFLEHQGAVCYRVETSIRNAWIAANGWCGIDTLKNGELFLSARYDHGRQYPGTLTGYSIPYGRWAHYVMVTTRYSITLYIDGAEWNGEIEPFESNASAGYDDLLLFAKQDLFNNSDAAPDASVSNLKIFYKNFTSGQVSQLYEEEIGISSEDNVHIMFVRQTSGPSDPNLLMECLARGPSSYSKPIINWFILDEDGIGALKLDQSGLNYIIYEESVSDNYRKLSALQLLQNYKNYTFVSTSYSWTAWISLDTPDDGCDNESMALIQEETCTQPIDIECRARYTGVYSNATGQVFDAECTLEGGLVCLGSQQNAEDGFRCYDYETRLLCPQELVYWTNWLDASDPDYVGDNETFSNHQTLNDSTLCMAPLFAQCRVIGTNLSWTSSGANLSYPYVCSSLGLVCLEEENTKCEDFEVRYACPYPQAVSSDEYWDLSGRLTVDGPEPTDCSTHANDDIYSNTGHPVDPSSHQNGLEYTTAPSQKCAVQTSRSHSRNIKLGNFNGECLSKIGWCSNGVTISIWIKQYSSASGTKIVFFTSGGDASPNPIGSNGFSFSQDAVGMKSYRAEFRSDGLHWDDITIQESAIILGQWFHVTLTFDDTIGGKLYINGAFQG
eukprot:XP_011667210.1 PREDICTED: uncharacterized protein LOC105439669 [Strongylocentrotus purpuratus]